MPRRKQPHAPVIDPANIPDAFASGFDVQDWQDWVRVVGFADDVAPVDGNGGSLHAVRRKSAAVIVPRSSLPELIDKLQESLGHRVREKRHS